MEIVYGLTGLLIIISLWLFCGWLVVCSMNFVAMYLNGDKFFTYEEIPEIVHIFMGPFMFVFFLYPVWFLIKVFGSYLRNNIGRTVVVEDIRKYSSSYRQTCISKCSVKSLANFFNVYMEKETSKFYHTDTGDKNALENFFRVDGWRNVSDGVWTKIVKVKDLNIGEG